MPLKKQQVDPTNNATTPPQIAWPRLQPMSLPNRQRGHAAGISKKSGIRHHISVGKERLFIVRQTPMLRLLQQNEASHKKPNKHPQPVDPPFHALKKDLM